MFWETEGTEKNQQAFSVPPSPQKVFSPCLRLPPCLRVLRVNAL